MGRMEQGVLAGCNPAAIWHGEFDSLTAHASITGYVQHTTGSKSLGSRGDSGPLGFLAYTVERLFEAQRDSVQVTG